MSRSRLHRAGRWATLAAIALAVTAACVPPVPEPDPDVVAPVLSLPADLTGVAEVPAGAEITWTATAIDDIDGIVPVTCTPGPGTFAIGTTQVDCSATDAAGNTATGGFTVTVSSGDTTPPTLSLPADLTVLAADAAGAEVSWAATATDDFDGTVAVSCVPGAGTFAVGTTQVDCSATDAAGNTATGGFSVTVTAAPTVTDPARKVSVGSGHACALLTSGKVSCWGANNRGQLGNGTLTASTTAVAVANVTDAIDLSAGGSGGCVVHAAGTVSCWGFNNRGQLGNGTTTTASAPVAVTGITDAVAVQIGAQHACALRTGGAISCWGHNNAGQLGNGATTQSTVPVDVAGISGATFVHVGAQHTCAVLADTTAACWGNGNGGRLGNGSDADTLTPTAVTGLTGVTAIESTDISNCAIADGVPSCWGANYSGQLGYGGNESYVPIQGTGITDATGTASGWDHACAVRTSGTVSCWGGNFIGQLGVAAPTDYSVEPVSVTGLTTATQVSAAVYTTCAVRTGGTVVCWGSNNSGELGNGNTVASWTPVAVLGLP